MSKNLINLMLDDHAESNQRIRHEAEDFRRKGQAKLKKLRENHKWISEKGFKHLERKFEKEYQKRLG